MLTPEISTSEAHAVVTAAGLFAATMDPGEIWRFSSSVACYIRQGTPAPLVNPDDVFTSTHGTETLTAAAHGLQTGDGPFQVSNAGGALPSGLLPATDYWIIRVDANDFRLATSRDLALAGTPQPLADDGTGTHTLSDKTTTTRVSGFLAAAATGSMLLAAGEAIYLEPGFDQGELLSVIRASGDGTATLTRMRDRPTY